MWMSTLTWWRFQSYYSGQVNRQLQELRLFVEQNNWHNACSTVFATKYIILQQSRPVQQQTNLSAAFIICPPFRGPERLALTLVLIIFICEMHSNHVKRVKGKCCVTGEQTSWFGWCDRSCTVPPCMNAGLKYALVRDIVVCIRPSEFQTVKLDTGVALECSGVPGQVNKWNKFGQVVLNHIFLLDRESCRKKMRPKWLFQTFAAACT